MSSQKHDATSQVGDREIHRLFDGDLSPTEREAVEAALRASGAADAREKLEGLGEVRAVVREASSSADPEPVDADALWARIAARIEGASDEARPSSERVAGVARPERGADEAAPRPALRVLDGGRATEKAPGAANGPPGSDEARERERRVRQRRGLIMLVGGLAAAAAAVIAIVRPGESPVEDPVVATTETHDPDPAGDPLPDEQLRRTEVIAVDFGQNVGTVFSVEGAEGSRYAVVWLTDEADKVDAPREGDERGPRPDEVTPDDTAHL